MNLPVLHKPEAVAEYLDVNVRTVKRWIAAGALVGVRFGKRMRVLDEELQRFSREGTCKKNETERGNSSSSAAESMEPGKSAGTTAPLDRRFLRALALKTANSPGKRSQGTSSSTRSQPLEPTRP